MAYNQPFHDATIQNPWTQDGPRYGNAYDNLDTTRPMESNKTELPNPYQYTGTRLAEQDGTGGNAYSGASPAPPPLPDTTTDQPMTTHPNKWRLLLRVILLVSAVGHLGFAAGASPRSGQPPPLAGLGCFYYLYAVAAVTILYCLYHIGYYLFRRWMHGMKTSRALMTAADVVLAIMWGVGVIVDAAKYKCPPGQYDGWCDFYNVSLFFGFLCFAGFLVAAVWDVAGGCIEHKRSVV